MRAAAYVLPAALSITLAAGCGSERDAVARDEPRPEIGPTVPVGERGNGIGGIAVGPGGVWVATGGGCKGSVSRIDPGTNEVVASAPVGEVYDVAVAAGAVWALVAEPCSPVRPEVELLRLDSASLRVATRIPLDVTREGRLPDHPFGLAAGEGSVWVGLNFGPTAGEIVRIDPRTNTIAARVDAAGHVGEMAVGAGFVWFVSHPEWTDETRVRSASLYRIDPATNERSAALVDRELADLGGSEVGPVLAAGRDGVWVRAHEESYPHGPVALQIDARTTEVTRRPLPQTRWFSPLAESETGLWFLGDGLSRLDSRTPRIAQSVKLDVTVGDAAYDAESGTLWLAALTLRSEDRGAVVRVELP
jgi:hypothetical protein